jgi:hypothetical protein
MKSMRILAAGALLVLPLLAAAPLTGQVPLTPRALGMGGAYVGVARGHEALLLNPANLGLADRPGFSVAIGQLAIGGTMLGLDATDLPDIVKLNKTEESRRQELLAAMPAWGTEARFDARLPLFAMQSGGFGLGVTYGSVGRHSVGKDILELLLNGYEEGRTDYSVGNTIGSRATFWDVSAGYGRAVGPVSLGVTARYVHGGTILNSRLFDPRVDLDRREIEVEYTSVLARGGQGYGVDVGMAYQPTPAVTLSGAVSNAFSRMTWSEALRGRSLTLSRADFDHPRGFDLLTRYESSEHELDLEAVPLSVYTTAEGLYDGAYFPAVARLGAAWRSGFGTDLAASFQERLTEGRLSDGWGRMASVGVQQKIPLLTLRAGYATDLDGGNLLSGGLSLGPIQLGAARLQDGEADGALRSGWIGTFGLAVSSR